MQRYGNDKAITKNRFVRVGRRKFQLVVRESSFLRARSDFSRVTERATRIHRFSKARADLKLRRGSRAARKTN